MEDGQNLSRRNFLRLSAIAAASAMVAACGGQTNQPAAGTTGPGGAAGGGGAAATSAAGGGAAGGGAAATSAAGGNPAGGVVVSSGTAVGLPPPSSFKEAPMLAELVKANKLPPVEQRLPKKPYVVPHKWVKPGKYGGVMHTSSSGSDDWGMGGYVCESMYGHSILRYLQDGAQVGPGLAESWQSNADASQWTFHFRDGLKWSDGQPWTVDDIMFWWDDMANDKDVAEGIPDECKSGKGTKATFKKIDNYTLQISFDAPAPLTADKVAMWVNGIIGPRWHAPKHYGQQFHKKYNPNVPNSTSKPWYTELKNKLDFSKNPDCPVVTGWKIRKYAQGQRGEWERNPYYWCVDKEGNQLPFIDRWNVQHFQDAQVQKLNILQGKDDFVNSGFTSLALPDVSSLKQAEPKSGCEVRFWDSGSGTGSIFFFNYDYKDDKMRKVIRMPEFRKALSHAYDRAEVRKTVYFNTGELTRGTISPKAIEYNINDDGKRVYREFRDADLKYDPELAKQMLDKIGCKVGPNGKRTLPDGSPLTVRLDQQSDASPEHVNKNQILAKNWQAIGIDAKINPVPPASYGDQWKAGALMSNCTWEVGDGPNHLNYPFWTIPAATDHWAPLHGAWYTALGTPKENEEKDVNPWQRKPPRIAPEPGGPIDQLYKLYNQSKIEPDFMKRTKLVWDMIRIHIDQGPFYMGCVTNWPRAILVKKGLTNVPRHEELPLGGFVNPWIHPTPAVYDPESWFWDNPSAHNV